MATRTNDRHIKILPPKVKLKKKKFALVLSEKIQLRKKRKELDKISKKLWAKNIWCADWGHWKPIEFCYYKCGEIGDACQFFHVHRWLCVYRRCKLVKRCRKRRYFCKDARKQIEYVKKYLELFIQWRRMRLKMDKEKLTKRSS